MYFIAVAIVTAIVALAGFVWLERGKAKGSTARESPDTQSAKKPEEATSSSVESLGHGEQLEASKDQPQEKEEISNSQPLEKEESPVEESIAKDGEEAMSDLDAMLDDAFDDILDDVAADMLLEETAADLVSAEVDKQDEDIERQKKVELAKKKAAIASYTPPKTWQETLSILDPKERLEWAKIIAKDITAQGKMVHQPAYSNAYKDGDPESKSGGSNAVAALVQGGAIVDTRTPKDLLRGAVKKAIVVVNKKDDKNFEPSEELLRLFKDQIHADAEARLEYEGTEKENVMAEPDRFKHCAALLQQSSFYT